MHPTIRSEGNRFVAPTEQYKKEVTRREVCNAASSCPGGWLWESVGDLFVNGAFFVPSGKGQTLPMYTGGQRFVVGSGSSVPAMTQDAGALACIPSRPCV
jgi:pectate lyase